MLKELTELEIMGFEISARRGSREVALWLFAKRAILESGGWAAGVSDADLVAGIRLLAEEAGIFTETAGGVTVAAALALAAEGRFSADDEVVLCITGNGLKTVDAVAPVLPAAPLIGPRVGEVRALVKEAS